MLDHVFTDAIGSLRDAVEGALLERQAFEERLQSDLLLGDLTWATSYALPGEGMPPRRRADITLLWPTWSQSAYRSWYLGESLDHPPRIEIEIVLRIGRLAAAPDPARVMAALPDESTPVGADRLRQRPPKVETVHGYHGARAEHAIDVTYEGSYELHEAALEDGSELDAHLAALGAWIATTLVALGDLAFDFLPADPTETETT
jgi:hypothetical protein